LVTDIPINEANLMHLMRGARARWKIENETFNTIKNQGYHFEHNFGHGYQHLSTVLMHLMMPAFQRHRQRIDTVPADGSAPLWPYRSCPPPNFSITLSGRTIGNCWGEDAFT